MNKYLFYLTILVSFSFNACINSSAPLPQDSASLSSPSFNSPPSQTSDIPSPTISGLSCQNLSGQIYSNKANYSFATSCSTRIEDYLQYRKTSGDVPLEGVEITYGNKKVISGKDGSFNIPENPPPDTKMDILISKPGYQPAKIIWTKGLCLSFAGLSQLTGEELKGRDITGNISYWVDNLGSKFPDYFTKDENSGFYYYIAKKTEQLEKLNEAIFFYNSESQLYSQNIDDFKNDIGTGKKMLVIFANNTGIFGTPPSPIDRVTETDEKIIFAEHKSGIFRSGENLPCGDNFQVKADAFLIPYTDKKLLFTANKYENGEKSELEVIQN